MAVLYNSQTPSNRRVYAAIPFAASLVNHYVCNVCICPYWWQRAPIIEQ